MRSLFLDMRVGMGAFVVISAFWEFSRPFGHSACNTYGSARKNSCTAERLVAGAGGYKPVKEGTKKGLG